MSKSILLVEDDLFIRDLYKRQLDLAGFQTDSTATATEALQKVSQTHFDIILLDIMLPDMSGIDILKSLKANDSTKNIPVIMLSNMAQDDIMEQAKRLGANKYLIKSLLKPDQMLNEVNTLLSEVTPTVPQQT